MSTQPTAEKDRLLQSVDGSELREFRAGDVIRYTPEPQFPGQSDTRWCREGMAIGHTRDDGEVVFLDTYWGGTGDRHRLTATELAGARLDFRLDDYDALPDRSEGTWEKYAPEDRRFVSSQHRLQFTYYVRKGATEDIDTMIRNARERLLNAISKFESTKWDVEWHARQLAEIEATALDRDLRWSS